MIKCEDCKYCADIDSHGVFAQCKFPLPEWILFDSSTGGCVNKELEKECAVFTKKENEKS